MLKAIAGPREKMNQIDRVNGSQRLFVDLILPDQNSPTTSPP